MVIIEQRNSTTTKLIASYIFLQLPLSTHFRIVGKWIVRWMPTSLLPRMPHQLQALLVWQWLPWQRDVLQHQGWEEDLCSSETWRGRSRWIAKLTWSGKRNGMMMIGRGCGWNPQSNLELEDCSWIVNYYSTSLNLLLKNRHKKMLIGKVELGFIIFVCLFFFSCTWAVGVRVRSEEDLDTAC